MRLQRAGQDKQRSCVLKGPVRYVIAVKRDMRDRTPADWADRLRGIAGLRLLGDAGGNRVQVEADEQAIAEAKGLLSPYCHIEPLILHKPL